jgi:uncharacterized protein YwgA
MPESKLTPEAWVATATEELRRANSWTGRIHLHKLLSTLQLTGLAQQPFEFQLYYYGPYSPDLDATIADMELMGCLDREYVKPGYGPRYKVTRSPGQHLSAPEKAALCKGAQAFGERKTTELELIATCLWMEKRQGIKDENEIAQRVRKLKPKYTLDEIRQHITKAHQLEAALCSS